MNGDPNHYKFTGKERDAETGLDYFGARHYSNGMGRFITPDWAAKPVTIPYAILGDPQSLNLYGYVRNIPTSLTDGDGHGWWSDFGSGFYDGAIGGLVQTIAHPINTAVSLGHAAIHPVNTAVAVGHAAIATGKAILSGDGKAIGQVAGTIVSAVATAGAGKLATSLVKGAEVAETASTLSKAERLAINATNGRAGEQAVAAAVKAEGQTVLGQQVGVRTSQGIKKVDIPTRDAAGNLKNIEAKTGNAVRNASQVAKDNEIATKGGTYVGKNAPEGLRGQTIKVPTDVRKP